MGLDLNVSNLDKLIEGYTNQILNEIMRSLRYAGEIAVNEAKNNGAYQDRTANLRNSIGYAIIFNGVITEENFSLTTKGKEPSDEDPISYGKNLLNKVSKDFNGLALVVVAGMKYGAYVEAKGYNVLTSAEQIAAITLKRIQNRKSN